MLGLEDFMTIQALVKRGVYRCDIAEQLGVHPKTVSRAVQRGYSRRFHFWATDCEDAEHTYEALVRAFEWFGGVPAEVLVDNQKAAVLAHRRGRDVQFHPRFLDLAGHYGFQIGRASCRERGEVAGEGV